MYLTVFKDTAAKSEMPVLRLKDRKHHNVKWKIGYIIQLFPFQFVSLYGSYVSTVDLLIKYGKLNATAFLNRKNTQNTVFCASYSYYLSNFT